MSTALSPLQPSEETAQETSPKLTLPLDPLLVLAAIGLGVCSFVTIGVATKHSIPGDPSYYATRQVIYLVVGLVAMLALSRLDYTLLRRFKYQIYGVLLLSVLAAIALGTSTLGSTRAISLPFFSFQASELGKVLLCVFLAGFLVDKARKLRDKDTTVQVVVLALLPTLLVVIEPDVGSALVYIAIALMILYIGGVPWRHLAALAVLGVLAIVLVLVIAPALGIHVLPKYQVERLTGFLNPSSHNVKGIAYQQVQSQIAIGAGQQTGLAHAGAASRGFVPYDESDFIFASVGEQHGFIGAALVLSLYALLIWRALRILTAAKDLFGALIAAGVTAMLMFQVFVNVGMAIGIMPITGITLPLMSYGGSSVVSTMIALGLLQSIYVRARSAEALKARALGY